MGPLAGTPCSAIAAATTKVITPAPRKKTAAPNNSGAEVRKALTKRMPPIVMPACTALAITSGRAILAPAITGKSCCMAPSMTCIMKPTVMRWVSASADGVQREANNSGPLHSSRQPALMANRGAVRKKRSGALMGGPWSNDKSACIRLASARSEFPPCPAA